MSNQYNELDPDANMAEILRAWDDEEDEMVEFIQTARPGGEETSRHRAENGGSGFRDVEIHEDGRSTLRQPREKSALTGKPRYLLHSRFLKATALLMTFFGLGMTYAMYGPTMADLALHNKINIPDMTSVFSGRAAGYLIGSIIGGWMFNKYDPYLVLGGASLGVVLGVIIFPLVENVAALAIMALLVSLALGAVDRGGSSLLSILWPNKSASHMQYLHFMFGMGAFFAPLLVKPFLIPEHVSIPTSSPTPFPSPTTPNITNLTTTTPNVTNLIPPTTPLSTPTSTGSLISSSDNKALDAFISSSTAAIVPVTWAYWINAIPFGISGVIFLIFAFLKTCKEPYTKKQERLLVASGQNSRVYTVVITMLFVLLLLLFVGIQVLYGGLIFVFVVQSKSDMTKNGAALLTAGYWGSFAFARLAAIPLSKYLKPPRMLLFTVIGSLLGGIILISQFSQGCDEASNSKLWAATLILGVSMSCAFPAIMGWAEYFLDVTGRIETALIIGSCLGEMLVPATVGRTLDSTGPCTLMYCVFAMSVLGLMSFATIVLFARQFSSLGSFSGVEFRHRSTDGFEEPPKPRQHDDEVLKLLEQNNEIFANGNGDSL